MKTLSIATESIAFQSKSFFRNLTTIISNYHASPKDNQVLDTFKRNLGICIAEHTGMMAIVHIVVGDLDTPLVAYPVINPDHVLGRKDITDSVRNAIRDGNSKRFEAIINGIVDAETATVSGDFSKIQHDIVIPAHFTDPSKFEAELLAAAIIHEVGHMFTMLQMAADAVVSNIAMAEAARQFMQEPDYKKARLILNMTSKALGDKECTWVDEITDDQNRAVGAQLYVMHTQAARADGDNKKYFGYDNSEELADIFMVRHGAGEAGMRLRQKTDNMMKNVSENQDSLATAFAPFVATLTAVFATGLIATMGASAAPLLTIPLLSSIISGTRTVSVISRAMNYKEEPSMELLVRKLRNQLIAGLKSSKLPKDQLKDYMRGIERGTAILEEGSRTIDPPRFHLIVDFFSKDRVQRRKSREYTERLENMVANELFVKAHSLLNR